MSDIWDTQLWLALLASWRPSHLLWHNRRRHVSIKALSPEENGCSKSEKICHRQRGSNYIVLRYFVSLTLDKHESIAGQNETKTSTCVWAPWITMQHFDYSSILGWFKTLMTLVPGQSQVKKYKVSYKYWYLIRY